MASCERQGAINPTRRGDPLPFTSAYHRAVGSLISYRRFALFGVYVSLGCTVFQYARHHAGAEALSQLACMSALFYWCTLDAHIHGKTFHHGWALQFSATCPVSLTFYLVWTRGWRGLWAYAKAVGLCVVTTATAAVLGGGLR
jgi:hypothetical protein